jgi:glycosyltransferase involved in cell wall biosynthesis
MQKIELSILIPAYNDSETIGAVIKEADIVAKKIATNYEIRVINDASYDDTSQKLTKLQKVYPKLTFATHLKNAGYGGTIRELYQTGKYSWLFTVPGDYQISPLEILKLTPYATQADMIIGRRINRHDPPERLRQSKIYNTILRLLYGIDLHDVNSVRLVKRDVIKSIVLSTTSAFVDAELVIDAKRQGKKVIEIPIIHKARGVEAGAGGGNMRTILPTIKDMLLYWWE